MDSLTQHMYMYITDTNTAKPTHQLLLPAPTPPAPQFIYNITHAEGRNITLYIGRYSRISITNNPRQISTSPIPYTTITEDIQKRAEVQRIGGQVSITKSLTWHVSTITYSDFNWRIHNPSASITISKRNKTVYNINLWWISWQKH
jgi:hypothetical protein